MKLKIFLFLSFFLFPIFLLNAKSSPLIGEVHEIVLPNQMKFLLVERKTAPVFAAYIRVKVGGVDETKGLTGIAHMLEHMAFKGTSSIGVNNYAEEKKILDQIEKIGLKIISLKKASSQANKNEIESLQKQMKVLQQKAAKYSVPEEFSLAYTRNGASSFNATTSKDLTSYFVELPKSKFELWAYLESEKLYDPVFREFYQERDVVMEERRMRVDNSPFGKLYEELVDKAFEGLGPNQYPTIGYASDIETLSVTDLEKFYKTYYVPGNIIGVLVGDLDPVYAKGVLEKYFSKIPAGKTPPVVTAKEYPFAGEKKVSIQFPARPQLMIAFHKPTIPTREDLVFDLIYQLLCEGRTSVLSQDLIEKRKIAQQVECDSSTPGVRLNNLFMIYAEPLGDHSVKELEEAILENIQKFSSQKVSDQALKQAKKQILSDTVFKMNSNLGLADLLSYYQLIAGDWHLISSYQDLLSSVSADDIKKISSHYLVKNNRIVATLHTKK